MQYRSLPYRPRPMLLSSLLSGSRRRGGADFSNCEHFTDVKAYAYQSRGPKFSTFTPYKPSTSEILSAAPISTQKNTLKKAKLKPLVCDHDQQENVDSILRIHIACTHIGNHSTGTYLASLEKDFNKITENLVY